MNLEKKDKKKILTKKYVVPCASPAKTGQCFILQVAAFIRLNRNKDEIKIEIKYLLLTFLLMNIFLDDQKNSANAVAVAKAIPKSRTRKAPLTFAKVKAVAPLGALRNALEDLK